MNIAERRKPSAPRDRQLIADRARNDHFQGWTTAGMGKRCPVDVSKDYRRGFADGLRDRGDLMEVAA